MRKDIFEYIADFIKGRPNTESDTVDSEREECIHDNGISKKRKLLDNIISTLKANYLGQQITFEKNRLILWIQDNLFYHSIIKSDFKEEFITSLYAELGFAFGAVEIKYDPTKMDLALTEIMPNVFLQIESMNIGSMIRKATLYSVEGYGSLLNAYCTLDSQEIQKIPDKRYNIGIGRFPKMPDGSFRENQIAIDDNQNLPQFEKNKYVSRAHAHIVFSEEYGFLLYVEHGGTRIAQKRTHVYRGDERIELNNTIIPEALRDGDCIVLSKCVRLLFKES